MPYQQSQKPRNFSLSGLFRLARVQNLLIIAFTQYLVAVFLTGAHGTLVDYLTDYRLALLVLSTLLIAAAGYMINDYYDVKIDLINKPKRVVVGTVLKRRVVMVFHLVLNFMGVVLGLVVGWIFGLIHFFSAGLLWLYSNQLKRIALIGNLSIALLTGLSVLLVGILYQSDEVLILAYSLFAFYFTLVREVVKDLQDVKGDLYFGCRTLPIVWGIRRTKWVVYFLVLLLVVSIALIVVFSGALRFLWISFFITVPIGIFLYKLYWADTMQAYGNLGTLVKIIMLMGVLSIPFSTDSL